MIGNEDKSLLIVFYLVLIALAKIYALAFVVFALYVMSKRKALDKYLQMKNSKCWQILERIFVRRQRPHSPKDVCCFQKRKEESLIL